MERLTWELERTLGHVRKHEGEPRLIKSMHDSGGYMGECVGYLISSKYVGLMTSDEAAAGHPRDGLDTLVVLTAGRTYWSERRRLMFRLYGPAFFGVVGTLLGVALGWYLAHL